MITEELASIKKRIQDYGFKYLLLAVSGGLDSICLAHFFIKNREALGVQWLGIAHVHHGLREGTADRDATFVESFAKSHGIPFFLKRLDGEALKKAEGSLEDNARDARYKALIEIAKKNITLEAPRTDRVHNSLDPIASSRLQDETHSRLPSVGASAPFSRLTIVTAHHAGDQAETMYMRLRRGTTLAGLRGIQEFRALSQGVAGLATEAPLEGIADAVCGRSEGETSPTPPTVYCLLPTISIYRPLLNTTRAELISYAQENNLEWCEDESNADVKFARNKIRHQSLPHLEKEVPGSTKQLCRIAERADKAYANVLSKCNTLFSVTLKDSKADKVHCSQFMDPIASLQDDNALVSYIALDKKKLNKILGAHKETDLSEMFRLWLSEQGFRFPIGFFFAQKEPANVKIPHRAAYRKRAIAKFGSTIRICEFESVEAALKFVSCN